MATEYRRRIVMDVDFDLAVTQASQAFRAEGMELIAETDVRNHFRHTLGHDWHNLRRYLLFLVWSPDLALETYQRNPDGEAILPASFLIDELSDGRTAITVSEPLSWLLWDPVSRKASPGLAAFADAQDEKVARAMTTLQRHLVKLTPVASVA